MTINLRQCNASRDELSDALDTGEKVDQRWMTFQHYPSTAAVQDVCVTDELNGVAEPLLGMQQDAKSLKTRSVPRRRAELARPLPLLFETPLVFAPALLES